METSNFIIIALLIMVAVFVFITLHLSMRKLKLGEIINKDEYYSTTSKSNTYYFHVICQLKVHKIEVTAQVYKHFVVGEKITIFV